MAQTTHSRSELVKVLTAAIWGTEVTPDARLMAERIADSLPPGTTIHVPTARIGPGNGCRCRYCTAIREGR